MGLQWGLIMLLPLICIFWSQDLRAQSTGSSNTSARSLDALLQDYAYSAFPFPRPRTGIPYDGQVPSNLTGINITAMRLRSGSLRTRGVKNFNEFEIPIGVVELPYVERLVLVYHNLGNWSSFYYPLPGYTYLTPLLGLLAYSASNLSAKNLPELDITASGKPISINFQDVKSVPKGSTPQCVYFDLNGSRMFNTVLSGNICSTVKQGHFSIVMESIAPSPAPVLPFSPPLVSPPGFPIGGGEGERDKWRVWKIVGAVVGGLVLLIVLGFLLLWVQRYKQRKKMQEMENEAEIGESLQMTSIGNLKAPVAMGTRTQPVLENEYVP